MWAQRLRRGSLGAFLGLALTCALGSTAAAQAPPYEIDVIASMTGTGAFVGATTQTTLRLVEAVVNQQGGVRGQPIHFVIQDDQTNPQVALQLAAALVSKHVPVIIGPNLAAQARVMVPIVNADNGPLLFSLTPLVSPMKGGNLYNAYPSGADIAGASIRFFASQGFQRLALLVTTDASGQAGEADVKEVLARSENRALALVALEHLSPTDLSIAAQIAVIKAARPDAVYAYANGTSFGTVLKGLHDAGMDVPVITSAANLSLSQVKQYSSFLPTNVYFQGTPSQAGAAENAGVRKAQQLYFEALKRDNVGQDLNAFAWDPAMIVVDALRHFGIGMTTKQLRDHVDGLRAWPGISGSYDFQAIPYRGLSQQSVVIMRWDKDRDGFTVASKLGGAALSGRRVSQIPAAGR